MKYLLDTNFVIFLMKGDLGAIQFIKHQPPESFYLSTITVGELYLGAYKSQKIESNLSKVEVMINSFQVLDFDLESAKIFAQIRSDLEKKGTVCGPYDMQIAAIAKWNHCTVVTRNLSEFTRVQDLSVMGY